jgi:glucose/arabinose dehydrogenase
MSPDSIQPFKRLLTSRPWPGILFLLVLLLATWRVQAIESAIPLNNASAPAVTQYSYLPFVRVPSAPKVKLVPFATDFNTDAITDIAHAGDNRLFVVQRNGIIRIVNPDGSVQPTPFLDINHDVSTVNWEEGMLGLVFHLDFPETPYVYITYTSKNSKLTLVRYAVKTDNPNVIDPQSVRYLMVINKPPTNGGVSRVHNAGDMAFGPDGYLYIAVGDGGPDPFDPNGVPGDPFNHGQRRDLLLAKILRIDVDPDRGLPADCGLGFYSIPPDNPFLGDGSCDEIWATGLRNPWRFSFDRLNGDFYMGDVGEWIAEEINYQPAGAGAGANYGWHCYEGIDDYTDVHPELAGDCNPQTQYTFPAYFYDHSNNDCSVVGGYVYRGQQYPILYGHYLFGDFCTGRTWTMVRDENDEWVVTPAGETGRYLSTFAEAVNGELYAGTWLPNHGTNNAIYHVVAEGD